MIVKFIAKTVIAMSVMAAIACPSDLRADTVNARCDIYPAGSAILSVMKPNGVERVLEFDSGEITSPDGGNLSWNTQDGDWYIQIDDQEFYIVPDAALNG